eukprot:gnl/MRDRNA2_/MRDRNA2_32013_c0_seq1.p1 gnl/MRDRNA2_/MRDRNA2_32013_c0~~gnl/MRDRNA2_/MRDRNA2_32013_c0_seq1.p1  ORF type:complete len:314 (+),score=55.55 gnl/MRDRNA2_/MRDRNA2_32013_c0_seq1:96-1037(+)
MMTTSDNGACTSRPGSLEMTLSNSDEKYDKFDASVSHIPQICKKYHKAFKLLNDFLTTPAFSLICIVLAMGYFYVFVVGGALDSENIMKFASANLEVLGLLILRHKILLCKSVNGVSGMSMLMYAAVYFSRVGLFLPYAKKEKWGLEDLDLDSLYGALSFFLVLNILKSIFATYRITYQDDLDTLKATYLIPGCFMLSMLIHPEFNLPGAMNFFWGATLYMDVLALMPQVVMMANGGGKVEAPIAHFVAATAVSRSADVMDSVMNFPLNHWSDWGVIFVQTVHLLLVADFMYYYMKARLASKQPVTDVVDIMV